MIATCTRPKARKRSGGVYGGIPIRGSNLTDGARHTLASETENGVITNKKRAGVDVFGGCNLP